MPAQPYYVLITGGRDYAHALVVNRVLDAVIQQIGMDNGGEL